MANAFYDGNQVTVAENENNQTEEKKEGQSGEITNDYIGYLNIPKIIFWVYFFHAAEGNDSDSAAWNSI